jgi:hypothetical protein
VCWLSTQRPAHLVGIDGPRDELIQLVVGEDNVSAQHLKVIAIVGFGGLGKTTLANEIYRKLEGGGGGVPVPKLCCCVSETKHIETFEEGTLSSWLCSAREHQHGSMGCG